MCNTVRPQRVAATHSGDAKSTSGRRSRNTEGPSGIPARAFFSEELTEFGRNEASPLSDGRRGLRPRHCRVNRHHRHESYHHRKNAERKSHAAPMSRVGAHSFAERNCSVAQSSHGCRCTTVACRSGSRSSRWADDWQNSGTPNWRPRQSQPRAAGCCYSCEPPTRNSRVDSSCRNPAAPGRSQWRCPAHSMRARKYWGGTMNSPKRTA